MIDSSLFGATIPAATYNKGDVIQLDIVDGPSVVRSGRGAAKLKRLTTGQIISAAGSTGMWQIFVKNSDWIDPMSSLCAALGDVTALDEKAGSVQRGHDCDLTPNSAWEVYAVAMVGFTTTVANSIFALIDIDYPSVSSIIAPDNLIGFPTSINQEKMIDLQAGGGIHANWTTVNVDFFKAGFMYALDKLEMVGDATTQGFISLSNAAGMAGLKRIMPIASSPACVRNKVEYASQLQKGPMDIGLLLFDNTGTASTGKTVTMVFDFVKRRVA